MKYARKRDANERSIIEALESAGAAVVQLEPPAPDLLVEFANVTWLVEVKDHEGGVETRVAHRRNSLEGEHACLTPSQVKWWARWRGKKPIIVQNAEEALRAIGVKR